MVDLINAGAPGLISLAAALLVVLIGLVLWFFVHRASSRANEQIALLEALLDQQKRQNALLRRLCDANEPQRNEPAAVKEESEEDADSFIRLVAER